MHFKDVTLTAISLARNNIKLSVEKEPILSVSQHLSDTEFLPLVHDLQLTTSGLEAIVKDVTHRSEKDIKAVAQPLADIALGSIISFRESVNPTIKEFSDAVKRDLDAFRNNVNVDNLTDKVSFIDIPDPVAFYPSLFDLPKYNGLSYPSRANRYNTTPLAVLPGMRYDSSGIFTNIATGNTDADRTIHKWLTDVDPESLSDLLDLFTSQSSINDFVELFNPKGQNKLELVNVATYAMLLCDKNLKEVNADTVDIGMASYKDRLTTVKGIAGITLNSGIRMLKRALDFKNLIVSKNDNGIVVLQTLYYDYVDAGGSVSSLVGYLTGDSSERKLSKLIDTIAGDTQRYELTLSMEKRSRERKYQSFVRNVSFNIFMRLFTEDSLTKLEREYYGDISFENIKAQVLKRLRSTIDSLEIAEFLNLDVLGLKLVCRARFPFTQAEEYLTSMIDIHTSNPGISIEDIRYLANVQYVSRYLSSMLTYSKIF